MWRNSAMGLSHPESCPISETTNSLPTEAALIALSEDLRERVVEAVVLRVLSRNQAAARFKVSVASAVRYVKLFKTTAKFLPRLVREIAAPA